MGAQSLAHSIVVSSLILVAGPLAVLAQGTIEGTVTFWGDPGGGTQLEIAASQDPTGPPDEFVYISTAGGAYSIPVSDGTYYLSTLMARDGNFGRPRPEDVLVWYDADADGERDTVTVSGGSVTGVDIDLGFVYVDGDATGGANNGSSWADAFTDLQNGIDLAVSGIEVWVAEGTYIPGANRVDSFYPKMGVRVCGGFTGVETIRQERDWNAHPTILSGEIDTSNHNDNCYNVVNAEGASPTALLDGVTITRGYAHGGGIYSYGGGIRAHGGGVTVANSILVNNHAAVYGGGISTANPGTVIAVNSSFVNNDTDWYGGGFYIDASSQDPSMAINCVFTGNTAVARGGGIAVDGQVWNSDTEPWLINLSLSGNSSGSEGGGIFVNTPTHTGSVPIQIHNSILWGNTGPYPQISVYGGSDQPIVTYSIVQGGWTGTNILTGDPLFADAELRLDLDSPAIDAGDNSVVPFDTYDADGNHFSDGQIERERDFNPRFTEIPYVPNTGVSNPGESAIDMGAYEALDLALIFFAKFELGNLDEWDVVSGGS